MTVWLGLPGGEGGLLGLLPWLPCLVFSRVHFSSGCLGVCLSWGGLALLFLSVVVSRGLPGVGVAPLRKFLLFRFSEVWRGASSFSFSFIFGTSESFLISAGQSRLFSVSELHDFGVYRFSLTFCRFQRWMLREIGDRYLHDDFQLTLT